MPRQFEAVKRKTNSEYENYGKMPASVFGAKVKPAQLFLKRVFVKKEINFCYTILILVFCISVYLVFRLLFSGLIFLVIFRNGYTLTATYIYLLPLQAPFMIVTRLS